ncbi:hypothetical protein HPP92_007100 [Vanilla planifolia]|uniref:Uncharacterized protein n=1 Tax=Vanilla planifolia TaxID=51239 RepID=A0A835V5K3_VANPL|nr:hypothetical protein HPP92_007100 [Vanilla planifolia]
MRPRKRGRHFRPIGFSKELSPVASDKLNIGALLTNLAYLRFEPFRGGNFVKQKIYALQRPRRLGPLGVAIDRHIPAREF